MMKIKCRISVNFDFDETYYFEGVATKLTMIEVAPVLSPRETPWHFYTFEPVTKPSSSPKSLAE